jgi:hypothetical protein
MRKRKHLDQITMETERENSAVTTAVNEKPTILTNASTPSSKPPETETNPPETNPLLRETTNPHQKTKHGKTPNFKVKTRETKSEKPQISGDAETGARWCEGLRRSSHHWRTVLHFESEGLDMEGGGCRSRVERKQRDRV